MPARDSLRPAKRRWHRQSSRRRLLAESLEDRRLLAVSFEFNYIGGNSIGFNDPATGAEFRAGVESAAARLGGWLLHDATIQLDVESRQFNGQSVAQAFSALPPTPAEGGFVDNVVTAKVRGGEDANGAIRDGVLEVFFFGPSDPFTFVTDPAEVDAGDELDFQAIVIHELAHTIGFTSATTASGSDDNGRGISNAGTWRTFDQFLSDSTGNRLIDADPQSPTAFQMDTGTEGWPQHSVGGKGPNAGLFFDGPIATEVHGARVPLYSPATFSLASSVGHLDSEGAPDDNPNFSPLTHLMSHAIISGPVPQELTLLEKAIFADIGIMLVEDTLPTITAPSDIALEGNSPGGFTGSNATLDDFLAAVTASDLFDPNVMITNDIPDPIPLGQNTIEFTATDASGNQATASAIITVVDTTAPTIEVIPTVATLEATYPGGVTGVTLPFSATVTDAVDTSPSVTFDPGSDFPLGTTTATYTATDASGNVANLDVEIIVQDTTAPEFTLPASITIAANLPGGADLNNSDLLDLFASAASDSVDQELTFTASPTTFPVGETTVTFTATDDSGNSTDAVTLVTVNAASFTVKTLDDELDDDPGSDLDDLSLREAISLANASLGSDQILFDAALSGTISLEPSLGQLQITETVSILGPGREVIAIDAQANSRVIDITPSGGDVIIEGLTITGGQLTGDNETGAGIRFQSDGRLSIATSTITANVTSGVGAPGGGLHSSQGDVSLTNTIVLSNSTSGDGSGGGGLWVGGDLALHRSTISGNSTSAELASGGGIYLLDGALAMTQSTIVDNRTEAVRSSGGGGILINSNAVIRDSTISGNHTQQGDSHGGGIRLSSSMLDLINSTVSGNHTQSSTSGGGGLYASDSSVNIHNSTITANRSAGAGGGIGAATDTLNTTLTIKNSIVAANFDDGTAPDFVGTGTIQNAASVGFSLIGDNTGTTLVESQTADPATGNLVGDPIGAGVIDPLVMPLSDNGGPTLTHSLNGSSPAIDAGNALFDRDQFSPSLSNDQRGDGFPRISASQIDIGAFETTGSVTIHWDNPADITFGTLLDETQLNAIADAPGTFVYTPAAGTRLGVGNDQPLMVEFTPDDTGTFDVTTATVFIDVLKADPIITWSDPESIVFGTPLGTTQLNASASIDGTFLYAPAAGTILEAGDDQVLSTTFTPTDTQNFNRVTTSVLIDVLPAIPVVSWDDPEAIVFGTRLSDLQLNATASIPGSFAYAPPAGVLLTAGNDQTLSVTFTPDDSRNFASVNQTVTIDVLKADPVIIWDDPGDIVVGTPLSETQLNASTRELGTFVYDPPAGTFLGVGSDQVLSATFTPTSSNLNTVTVTALINVVDFLDYGDAPSRYPVTLADNGARHTPGSLRLGATVDTESDGQPSDLADGDGDDDDGVLRIADLVAATGSETTSSISVTAAAAGKLDGWIDLNGDGDWDDDGEQIISSVDVSTGTNHLSFTIADGAVAGDTAARFRLSTAGGLAPTGDADDGEVEDYLYTLLDGDLAPNVTVELIDRDVTIVVGSESITVRTVDIELFSAPHRNVGLLNVPGSLLDETVTLQATDGASLPSSGLILDGGGGDDTLILIGEGGSFDLTAPTVTVKNFDNLDLTSPDTVTMTIDAAAVNHLAPLSNSILVRASKDDQIVVADADDWLMGDPININSRFIRTANNLTGGEVIGLEAENHWQNFLRTGDVNNDGQVTARDALRIINELARRNFSDGDTQFLQDAISVVTWPGVYFDHNGDGKVTALDALRVINDLARQSASEGFAGESVQLDTIKTKNSNPVESPPHAPGPIITTPSAGSIADGGDTHALQIDSVAGQRSTESQRTTSMAVGVDQLLADSDFLDQLGLE